MPRQLLLSLSTALLLVACAPKRDLNVDQIKAVTKLDDVMDAQATIADPLFKKHEQASFTDAEWAAFADASTRLQTSSLKAKDFSKGAGFDALAVQLHDTAAALGTAAAAKDAAGARKALDDMKATCKECHKKFR